MIGIGLEEQRGALEQDTDVLMALLRGETVDARTHRYHLVQARTQLTRTATSRSPSPRSPRPTGPRTAAKNGLGLLSVGATVRDGFDALALHWT